MAYVRKYNKRPIRVRRRPMRMRRIRKNPVAIARNVGLKKDIHYISRWVPGVDVTALSTTLASVGTYFNFSLLDVSNSTDFSNLFDNFKLIGVQLTFRLMNNPDGDNIINDTVNATGANFYPKLWWVIDKDDITSPTLLTIRERALAKCRVLKPDRFITVFIKNPRPQLTLTGSGVTTAPSSWLRTSTASDLGTTHYGIKVVLDKMGYTGNAFTVGVDKKYFFAFKNSK